MPEMDDESHDRQAQSTLRSRATSVGASAMTGQPQPRIQRASRMRNTTTDERRQIAGVQTASGLQKETDETFQPIPNQSSTKIQAQPIKGSAGNKRRFSRVPRFQSIPRRTRMVAIFITSVIIALLIVFLYQQLATLATTTWNDIHYGRPRTYQVDAFVGHETGKTPSHFIAINLHGHIEIFELPGGDPAHIQEYPGPQLIGPNADLIPPTLQFVDTPDSHLKDMILQAGDVEERYRNVQGTFRFP